MAKKTKIPQKLVSYLKKAGIKHEVLEHKTVYTALDVAQTMKKKLSEIAKSLLVKADKDYYVAIVPADNNVDFKKLGAAIEKVAGKKVRTVKIPGEKIMESVLKAKAGAMSAFGGLYKLPVLVDKNFQKIKEGVFSSGSFNHSIKMAVRDFINLEKASSGIFGIKKKIKKPKPVGKKKIKKVSGGNNLKSKSKIKCK